MSALWNWVIDKFTERSTWTGLLAILTGSGISIAPEMTESIISIFLGIFGVVEVARKEDK